MGTTRTSVVVAFAVAVVAAIACTPDGAACYPGDYVACDCGSGTRGYAQCASDGSRYGTCDCSGRIPGVTTGVADAGTEDAAPEAATLLSFLSPCDTNEQCATNLCFTFNAKGPHCSKPCSSASDCEAPSPGCNNQGICKVP